MVNSKIKRAVEEFGCEGPNSRGEYKIRCPFPECSGHETPKLYANPAKDMWHCFRCGRAGRGGVSFLGSVLSRIPDPTPEVTMPEGFYKLDKSAAMQPYTQYLQGRGVLQAAVTVGAGACFSGKYRGRVVIPIMEGGKWVGFVARAITWDARMPYLYPAGMPRKTLVWGWEWVKKLKDKAATVYWVEGVFDALPLFPFSVASLGKEATEEQMDRVVALGHPICVALDGDAWREAKSLARRLQMRGALATYAHLPPGTDPGTLGLKVSQYTQVD